MRPQLVQLVLPPLGGAMKKKSWSMIVLHRAARYILLLSVLVVLTSRWRSWWSCATIVERGRGWCPTVTELLTVIVEADSSVGTQGGRCSSKLMQMSDCYIAVVLLRGKKLCSIVTQQHNHATQQLTHLNEYR